MRAAVLCPFETAGAASAWLTSTDEVDELLEALVPRIDLTLDPAPNGDSQPMTVSLAVRACTDLTPAGVIAQVPELTALVLFRQRLDSLAAGDITEAEFGADLDAYRPFPALGDTLRRWQARRQPQPDGGAPRAAVPAAPERPAGEKDASLDRLFGMLDTAPAADGGGASGQSGSAIDRALGDIVGTRRTTPGGELAGMRQDIGAVVNRILDAILHHRRFKRVEAAVAALRRIRRRVRAGYEILVVGLGAAPRADALPGLISEGLAEVEGELDLLLLDHAFGHGNADLAIVRELATFAEQAQIPLVVGLAPDFLSARGGLPASIRGLADATELLAWRALREKPEARWLVAAFNEFLARSPYDGSRRRELEYRESTHGPEDLLWACGAWLVLERVLSANAEHGWPVGFQGARQGCIEGLDIAALDDDRQCGIRWPVNAEQAMDLAELGITAAAGGSQPDQACLVQVPIAFATPRLSDHEQYRQFRRMATLDFQLVAIRLARFVELGVRGLDPYAQAPERAASLQSLLQARVSELDRGAQVSMEAEDPGAGSMLVCFHIASFGFAGVPICLQAQV
jgi:hypothetical protein